MNYAKFRFRAVVDWVDIEFYTVGKHPGWRTKKASQGGFSFVTGLDLATGEDISLSGQQGANTPTTRFRARIQNSERFSSIKGALASVRDVDLSAGVTVRGIEISFDAYRLKGTTDEELVEMTAIMLHQIGRPEGAKSAPRFYSWKGTSQLRYGVEMLPAAISDGFTAMYGNKNDDYVVRGYLKDYDTILDENGKAKRVTLNDPFDHRARAEVRLQGQACPVRTLEDLEHFPFESLSRFFGFRQPDSEEAELMQLVTNRSGNLGNVLTSTGDKLDAHKRRSRPRKTKATTVASPLTEKARRKLCELSRRWQAVAGRGKVKAGRAFGGTNDENSLRLDSPLTGLEDGSITAIDSASNPDEYRVTDLPHVSSSHASSARSSERVLNTSLPVVSSPDIKVV